MTGRTLYQKLVDRHTVRKIGRDHVLLYVDFHILNEYTSPQAFSGLREKQRSVWRSENALAVVDHVNPTRLAFQLSMQDRDAARQISYLQENCRDFGLRLYDLSDPRQGIEHVVAPEQGFIKPGMVVVCGDSHTTSYGALGALGFGIGTSDVEHALATQTVVYKPLQNMLVEVHGRLSRGVYAKDLIMEIIRRVGANGATGYAVEFRGDCIDALGVSERLTVCNMAMECGARAALMSPNASVIEYLRARPRWLDAETEALALEDWAELRSDPVVVYDKVLSFNGDDVPPLVSWGVSPDQTLAVDEPIPNVADAHGETARSAIRNALEYMGLKSGQSLVGLPISHAFIGSCTNSRIEDLKEVAQIIRGRKVSSGVRAIIVPGSVPVREQAEAEGLAEIFRNAGFEWRLPGCSMCLAMNDDVLQPGDRCASSTNRNFEGRQGRGARTHLMSPAMVALAAIQGAISDIREMDP